MTIQEKLQFMHDNFVISCHEHVRMKAGTTELDTEYMDSNLRTMDILGVDKCIVSVPLAAEKYCAPERFIAANRVTREALKLHPERFYGMAFLNPGFQKESLEELDRCVNEFGFIGVKLYHQYFMDDPVQYPLIEKCIDYDIPILMHCAHVTEPVCQKLQPRSSDGYHMANIGRRYPEATFITGHTGGGGDWQWTIKAIADCPNVLIDIGGSVHDRPQVEETYHYVGADRMLFATDGTWCSGVAKLLGAEIPEEDRKKIAAGAGLKRFWERAGK